MLSAAQLLDELMGRDRNLAPDEKRCNVRWDHETTCKYYLCGFCPAELFTNTRSDLGPCEKIHDENLRKMYEKSSRFMKEGYERDFLRYLQSLLAEVERRIRRGHARLALSQAQQAAGQGPGGPVGKNEEKATVLTEKIEDLVMQIEELGSEGRVEEAQGMMKLVEQLKDERAAQLHPLDLCGPGETDGDAQSRVDDHLMGKQHMGYAKIKSTVEELKKLNRRSEDPAGEDKGELESKDWEREREERETKRKLEEEEKEKEKEKEREKEKEKERERVKEREREREREREKRGRRSHSNSRHSSRASDRKRSRSRERRRSRSKERERKRSRSRDRDRERRRSRERSDRKRRSRSRERKRSRSSERKSHRHRSRSRDKDRTSRDKERKEPEERRSSSKKDEVLEDDKPSSDVAKPGPVEAEAPASTLGLALLARVNGAAQDELHSEGDTQSN
uniref:Luc7-like protein 3 n=1 Tax=Oncorhynchus tshawytscha TaxID=74940 RepID=A0AAZ3SAH9_ONCTS